VGADSSNRPSCRTQEANCRAKATWLRMSRLPPRIRSPTCQRPHVLEDRCSLHVSPQVRLVTCGSGVGLSGIGPWICDLVGRICFVSPVFSNIFPLYVDKYLCFHIHSRFPRGLSTPVLYFHRHSRAVLPKKEILFSARRTIWANAVGASTGASSPALRCKRRECSTLVLLLTILG
jgi:hypothetical protein